METQTQWLACLSIMSMTTGPEQVQCSMLLLLRILFSFLRLPNHAIWLPLSRQKQGEVAVNGFSFPRKYFSQPELRLKALYAMRNVMFICNVLSLVEIVITVDKRRRINI